MMKQITVGKEVTLRSALGEITRVATGLYGYTVAVCIREEYKAATKEGRNPATIGFKVADIVA